MTVTVRVREKEREGGREDKGQKVIGESKLSCTRPEVVVWIYVLVRPRSSSNRACELRNPVKGSDPVCQVLQEKAIEWWSRLAVAYRFFFFLVALYCAGNGVVYRM